MSHARPQVRRATYVAEYHALPQRWRPFVRTRSERPVFSAFSCLVLASCASIVRGPFGELKPAGWIAPSFRPRQNRLLLPVALRMLFSAADIDGNLSCFWDRSACDILGSLLLPFQSRDTGEKSAARRPMAVFGPYLLIADHASYVHWHVRITSRGRLHMNAGAGSPFPPDF